MPHTDFLSLPFSLPHIKSCHHHLSFVIKDCLSASDGHLQLLMSTNMEGMIRRILAMTNLKYIVSCYQWVTVKIDNVHTFISERGRDGNTCQSELATLYLMLLHNKICLDPCARYPSSFYFFFFLDLDKRTMDRGL